MRIATFNLDCFGGRTASAATDDRRIPLLRDALTRLRADVLCLQEVNAQSLRAARHAPRSLAALDTLLRGTAYEHFDRCVSTRDGPEGGTLPDVHNVVILSRYPIQGCAQIWHRDVPPPVYRTVSAEPAQEAPVEHRWDRPAVTAVIEPLPGRPLHVFNLHLRAPIAAFVPGQKDGAFCWKTARGWAEGFYVAALKRTGQALEVRMAVDAILDADPAAWIAVCGDLNADDFEMPVRILRADTEDTGNNRLANRVLTPIERNLPEPEVYSVLHAGNRHMLDHILVSHSLSRRYRNVEIDNAGLADEVYDAAAPADRRVSNHAPVVAEFDI